MFTTLTNQHMHEHLLRITCSCYCKGSLTSNVFIVQAKKTANSNAECFVSAVSNVCKQLTVAKSALPQRQFGSTGQARHFSPRQDFAKFRRQDEETDTILIFRVTL